MNSDSIDRVLVLLIYVVLFLYAAGSGHIYGPDVEQWPLVGTVTATLAVVLVVWFWAFMAMHCARNVTRNRVGWLFWFWFASLVTAGFYFWSVYWREKNH